jgi:O-6-methylguanine DNA methyltransferase
MVAILLKNSLAAVSPPSQIQVAAHNHVSFIFVHLSVDIFILIFKMLSDFAWKGSKGGKRTKEEKTEAVIAPKVDHSKWRETEAARALTAYRRAVYELTSLIPAGRVATYGTLAQLLTEVGKTPSPRAVGTALHHNPFAPTVPCHRIVASSSKTGCLNIGGFSGAVQNSGQPEISRKRTLLDGEGVPFDSITLQLAGTAKTSSAVEWVAADFPVDAVNTIRSSLGLSPLLSTSAAASPGKRAAAISHAIMSTPSKSAPVSGIKRKRGEVEEGEESSRRPSPPAPTPAPATSTTPSDDSLRAILASAGATGQAVRLAARSGALTSHTSGLAPGYAQANLVIVPAEHAFDFLAFCVRNPKPCPLLEVTDVGNYEAKTIAPGSDIRTDIPAYRVYRNGVLAETVNDITHLWPGKDKDGDAGKGAPKSKSKGAAEKPAANKPRDSDARSDWVAFLLGCSFSFEEALLEAHVPVRQLQEEAGSVGNPASKPPTTLATTPKNVPMYKTCIPTTSAGVFSGPLVVSMRPMTPKQAKIASDTTERFPRVHGK